MKHKIIDEALTLTGYTIVNRWHESHGDCVANTWEKLRALGMQPEQIQVIVYSDERAPELYAVSQPRGSYLAAQTLRTDSLRKEGWRRAVQLGKERTSSCCTAGYSIFANRHDVFKLENIVGHGEVAWKLEGEEEAEYRSEYNRLNLLAHALFQAPLLGLTEEQEKELVSKKPTH